MYTIFRFSYIKGIIICLKIIKSTFNFWSIDFATCDSWFIYQNFGLTKGYDWLSFYGSLVGSFVTIIGIKLTLDFESEQSRRDEKISYRPILRFSSKNLDNKGDFSKSQIILRDETSLKKFQENNIPLLEKSTEYFKKRSK